MESVCMRNLIYATHRTIIPLHIRRLPMQIPHLGFRVYSKQSDFQDFQSYAKPSRLLPATEVKVCTESSPEKIFTPVRRDRARSLYKVELHTSNMYGSGLSDLSAGILLCLIDENGDSILQRVPASLMKDHLTPSKDTFLSDMLHFQRGSVDEFTFEGPELEKVEALWIGLESGQWRLRHVSLTVICGCQTPLEETEGKEIQYIGFQYDFEAEDTLLGEGSDMSMVELRPRRVTELCGIDPFTILSNNLSQSISLPSHGTSNDESMREYADLKFSLLLYDAILIFTGTSVASFSGGENAGFAFLTGGIVGFLYLLLLQRSVDGLPAPASTSMNMGGNFDRMFGGFKSPIPGLAVAVGFTVLALRYSSGDVPLVFTPKDLIVGMMGFLSCKVAVVLAAFKPMPMGLKENK
ncbi:hypothetical protein L1049_019175 [Liquidambar formosana]|uniref:DUF7755 domain-containing protein n=1 Tax=Liquidambar formosana TaxID=63359 RepID=A0AAP0WP12_LIQFO